jgi:hypothetical protein
MQLPVNDPRLMTVGFVTLYFGWTIVPFPLSAFLDFSVWELPDFFNPVIQRSTYMKPVPSDTYVSCSCFCYCSCYYNSGLSM